MNDKLLIDRTLLEQALDALLHRRSGSDQVQRIDAAITDLCAALAQEQAEPSGYCTLEQLVVMQRTVPSPDKIAIYTAPPKADSAQEPVAWMNPDDGRVIPAQTMQHAREGGGASLSSVRSYTVALGPIRAQRPPLTDAEMRKLWSQYGYKSALCMRFARAIERKVRGE